MNISPAGQNFRDLLSAWDKHAPVFREEDILRQKEGHVRMLLYGNNFIFFFRYKEDLYGGSEEARLTFATMRAGEDPGIDEMMFGATNLNNALKGRPTEEFFRFKDLDDIHVIHRDVVEELLLGQIGVTKKDIGSKMMHLHKHKTDREKNSKHGLHQIDRDVE